MKRFVSAALVLFPMMAHADDRPSAPQSAASDKTSVVVLERPQRPREPIVPHLRFGAALDGALGTDPLGDVTAFAGLELRAGVQINPWFAVYYQGRGLLGATIDCAGCSEPAGGVLNSAMAELALPFVQIALGPSIDVGTSVFFGLDGRVAFVTGGHGPGRHGGFAVSLDVHPTFTPLGADVITSLGVGWEVY